MVKAYTAMKAQKQHDEVMRQPHSHGRARPSIGSDNLRDPRGTPCATNNALNAFRTGQCCWDRSVEKKWHLWQEGVAHQEVDDGFVTANSSEPGRWR